jgi:DNA-binding MarR family transcriptional regulator
MTTRSTGSYTDLWDALMRAQALVLPDINRTLRRKHGISLSEYTVLHRIVCADVDAVTMTELQAKAWMSAAGITRVVAALAEKELVIRSRSDGDRRLMYAGPTPAGRALLMEASRTIEAELVQLLHRHRDTADFGVAAGILRELGDAVT